jgi:hypothetical protein
LVPAVVIAQLTHGSEFSRDFLWVSLAAAAILAIVLLARAIHVYRMELHHERHVEAFWDRKLKEGGLKMWLAMVAQLAVLVAALVVIGYTSR